MSALDCEEFERRLRSLPERERFVFRSGVVPESFRHAAVLIPFWRERDEVFVVLTERARKLRSHGGMVSFPGGVLEEGESAARSCRVGLRRIAAARRCAPA